MAEYKVFLSEGRPEFEGLWEGVFWHAARPLEIACFRPEGSDYRPRTFCKLLHSPRELHAIFRVEDRHIRCAHAGFQAEVWRDSCVELFVQPKEDRGYFNFEFNCGGSLLASYVTDPTRIDGKVAACEPLTSEEGRSVAVYHSLPEIVEPEIKKNVTWFLEFSLPFSLLEGHVGPIGMQNRQWRANLYKCGNDTSRPHWASWAPIPERNFHAPASFGTLLLEEHGPEASEKAAASSD